MKKITKLFLIIVFCILVTKISISSISFVVNNMNLKNRYKKYTIIQTNIHPGDTLWSLAQLSKKSGVQDDIRNIIIYIKEINNLENENIDNLPIGGTIKIPVGDKAAEIVR